MPQISERGKQMPESPIRKLVPYAEKAKKDGRKVYHLNIGQPDIPTPEVALNAVKNIDIKVIEYSHSAGNESYRRKLAAYYQNIGINIDYTNIIITAGGSEAITFAFKTCLNIGDEVLIPEPFYANYNGFAVAAGIVIKPIRSYIEDGFALPDISEFERLLTPKTKGIVICNPNNPTGYLYSKDELLKLREIVKKYDLYLFSDEVYREFCYDGNEHFSVMQLEGIDNNVVLIDSVSKRYSECGVRIGAMITKNNEVIKIAMKFAQARLSPPSLGQIVGEASLETPKSYFTEVYNEYIERRNFVVEALNKMEGVFCPNPKGAFYVIARLPIDDCDIFAQWLLEDFSYNNQTVMLAPATGFYSTKGAGLDEVRIAYVLKKEDLKIAMECLEQALKVYPGRKN
ncbi:MAG: aspartate aminotransferase [Bacteroidetes bacterium RIFOXYA12_FULL_35_11]|nr:MAG: aspartate aminotransferase [Bacteroidetes bacterium GWF2_35_48]OFY82095.1 MAG: aspartate aminotransferase [Bacteroidetes bacterium RIFOXYA12_FULL_35_11]OFY93293.1 MAG: aspartate aminotransferase [Bacteroidetes bacterium RIFOXYC12_FULL_35_7]HBX53139.1 pyridoxal phosphate-dependent aminotransferase [Bacteroidales bacterium]